MARTLTVEDTGSEQADVSSKDTDVSFDDLRTDEVALTKLDDYVRSPTTGCKIEFVFANVTGLGDDAERAVRDALRATAEENEYQVGFCPRSERASNTTPFLSLESALRANENQRNVFYFGAVKFAALRSSERRAHDSLEKIIAHLNRRRGNSGARCIFTYNNKDRDEICKIFKFVYNNLHDISFGGDTLVTHLSILGFANISDDVKTLCKNDFTRIAEDFAQTVAEATFDTLLGKLAGSEHHTFATMRDEQIEKLKPSLVNGIVNGGSRDNDRPWGFDKVVEESRQRLLSALVRKMEPAYSSSSNIRAEEFIEDRIQPHFSKFSLPANNLSHAAPAAFGARKRQRRK